MQYESFPNFNFSRVERKDVSFKGAKNDRSEDFNYLRAHGLITDQDDVTEEGTKILTACCATASATLGEYYPENKHEYSTLNDPRW